MKYSIVAVSETEFEHQPGWPTSTLVANNIRLEVSKNLDQKKYLDSEELPTKEAVKPLTISLIMGLVSNMRYAAHKGYWKEGEHMEYVIRELQRAFTTPEKEIGPGTMGY
jgi:hypothetical protein